jgi:hypothetical protein
VSTEEDEERRVAVERALVIAEGARILASSQQVLTEILANPSRLDEDSFVKGVAITRMIVHAQRGCERVQHFFDDSEWPSELIDEQVFAGLERFQDYSPFEYVQTLAARFPLLMEAYRGLYARLATELELPEIDELGEVVFDHQALSALLGGC